MSIVPLQLMLRTRWKMLLLMAVAVFICAVAALFFIRYLVKPYYGLTAGDPELNLPRAGLVFVPEKPNSPALQAGLQPGRDLIMAVNGQAVSTIRQLQLWEYGHFSFEPVTVSVADPAGTVRLVTITPELAVTRYDWFFGLFFLIIMGGIALYIISHYHHEITHTLFALLVLCYMAYTAVRPFSYENLLVTAFLNLGELTAWLTITVIVFFQKDVLRAALRRIIFGTVLVIAAVFTVLRFAAAVRWFVTGTDGDLVGLRLVDLVQNYGDIIAYVLFLFLLVYTYVRTGHRDVKQHLEWIMAGALLSIPPHFFFNQVPQFLAREIGGFPQLGLASGFFLVFLPLSYLVGLVRSRGFRIRVLHSRSVVYFIVSFVLLAFYAVAWQPVYGFFSITLRLPEATAGFVVGLSLFITALYLQLVILLGVDHRILRGKAVSVRRNPRNFLESPEEPVPGARSLESTTDYETLAGGILQRCGRAVDQIRKSCDEMKKLIPAPDRGGRFPGKSEDEASPPEQTGGRIASRVRKEALRFSQFKKRFETFLSGGGAARISFSLDTLMEPVIRQCRRQWSGVTIRYRKRPGVKAFCSPEELSLCLAAVLDNACESLARREDGIIITAGEDGPAVFLEVADRGAGIPLKHLSLAGRPFFTTKRNHDGLGLFFTRLLLERNGGTCAIAPGSEQGTTVTVRVPKSKHSTVSPQEYNV